MLLSPDKTSFSFHKNRGNNVLIPNPQSKQIACSVIPQRKVIIYFLKNVDLTTLSACCLGSCEAFGKGMPTLRRLEESVVQPLVCQNTGLIISRSSLLAWRLSASHLQSPQEQQILRALNLNFFSKLQPAYMYATVNSSWQPLCSGPFFFLFFVLAISLLALTPPA